MPDPSLLNAPPRLSDLRGAALTEALHARKAEHDANWWRTRNRRPLLARIRARLFGGAAS